MSGEKPMFSEQEINNWMKEGDLKSAEAEGANAKAVEGNEKFKEELAKKKAEEFEKRIAA